MPKVEKTKLLNGRYLKIKKLGEGSFNVVYLAEDLLPDEKSRLLSKEHLELVGKLPENINPYRQMGYFDEYDENGNKKEDMEPELKKQLNDNETMLQENYIFEGREKQEAPRKKIGCDKKIKRNDRFKRSKFFSSQRNQIALRA